MIKKFLLLLTFASSLSADTVTLEKNEFNASNKLGDIGLIHRDKTFFVIKDDEEIEVQNAFVSKEVRNIPGDHLEKFLGRHIKFFSSEEELNELEGQLIELSEEEAESYLSNGYIALGQMSDGEYTIKSHVRVLGGGGFGAMCGAIVGKFVVHAIVGAGCGVIGIAVTCVAGPVAGAAAASGTWGVMAPATEVASNVVAMAGGLAAGVASGPV